jgi:hypothetical protein
MQPSTSRETSSPVLPKRTYSIAPHLSFGRGAAQQPSQARASDRKLVHADGGKRGRFYASASRRPRSRTLLQTRSQSPSAVMSGVWPAPSSVGRGMNAVPSPARWANGRSRLRAAAYRGSCRPRSRTTPSGAVIGEAIRTRPRGYGHQLTVAPPASQAESVSSQASSLRTGRSWTPPHILRPGHVGQALDGRHACDRNA